MDKKIQNTFSKAQQQIEKLQTAFRSGGGLEQALMREGADITAIARAARALKTALTEMAKISGQSKPLTEGVLDGEDEDGFMARSQLYFLARDAIALHGMIGDRDNLEPWVQSKITAAAEGMDSVRRYTEYKQIKSEITPAVEVPAGPENTMLEQAAELVITGDWEQLKSLLMSMDPAEREDVIRTVADQEPVGFGTMFPDQDSMCGYVSEAKITEFAPLIGSAIARLGAGIIANKAAGALAEPKTSQADTSDESLGQVAKKMLGGMRQAAEQKIAQTEANGCSTKSKKK